MRPAGGCGLSFVIWVVDRAANNTHTHTPAFALPWTHKHVWDKTGDETRGDRKSSACVRSTGRWMQRCVRERRVCASLSVRGKKRLRAVFIFHRRQNILFKPLYSHLQRPRPERGMCCICALCDIIKGLFTERDGLGHIFWKVDQAKEKLIIN